MLLVVQFRQDITKEHEQSCVNSRLGESEEIKYVSIFDEDIDFFDPEKLLKGVDKLILAGNGALYMAEGHLENDYNSVNYILGEIEPLIRYVIEKDFPTLAICFGYQLLGHFLGTPVVFNKEMAETGILEINITEEGKNDPLFAGVPSPFYSVVAHKDSLESLPHDCAHLAYSDKCKIHGFRYKKNVYATLFHNELNTEELLYRLSLFPHYKDFAQSLDKKNTDHALTVLKNFMRM